MNTRPNENNDFDQITWIDTDDEIYVESTEHMTWMDSDNEIIDTSVYNIEMADGTEEDSIADSDEDVQPSEYDWEEFMVRGGIGLTVGMAHFYDDDDLSTVITPMVMYSYDMNNFYLLSQTDRLWRIEDDGVFITPRESDVDLTSDSWEDLELNFETVHWGNRELHFPRVTGFSWEYFPLMSRPLGRVFAQLLEGFLDENSTRFEIIESLVRFHDIIHAFTGAHTHVERNFARNLFRAAGVFFYDVDIAFYFYNHTKSARPTGLQGCGQDFDKVVRTKILSQEQIGKSIKCRKCNMDTFTRWNTHVEIMLPNGSTRKESRRSGKCLNVRCKTFSGGVPSCHFCKQILTQEVKDGWIANLCTTYNCEQRFPFCPEHKKAMAYQDGDWECDTCLKVEKAMKAAEIEAEKAAEAKPDRFMAAFDEPVPEAPLERDAPAPAVEAPIPPVPAEPEFDWDGYIPTAYSFHLLTDVDAEYLIRKYKPEAALAHCLDTFKRAEHWRHSVYLTDVVKDCLAKAKIPTPPPITGLRDSEGDDGSKTPTLAHRLRSRVTAKKNKDMNIKSILLRPITVFTDDYVRDFAFSRILCFLVLFGLTQLFLVWVCSLSNIVLFSSYCLFKHYLRCIKTDTRRYVVSFISAYLLYTLRPRLIWVLDLFLPSDPAGLVYVICSLCMLVVLYRVCFLKLRRRSHVYYDVIRAGHKLTDTTVDSRVDAVAIGDYKHNSGLRYYHHTKKTVATPNAIVATLAGIFFSLFSWIFFYNKVNRCSRCAAVHLEEVGPFEYLWFRFWPWSHTSVAWSDKYAKYYRFMRNCAACNETDRRDYRSRLIIGPEESWENAVQTEVIDGKEKTFYKMSSFLNRAELDQSWISQLVRYFSFSVSICDGRVSIRPLLSWSHHTDICSDEAIMQLTSVDKLHHYQKIEVAKEIVLRAISRSTKINIDKHLTLLAGESIGSNSVNVALAWLEQLREDDHLAEYFR